MPPPDKKRKRLLEEDLLESKRSRDGGRTRSPIARSSRKCSSYRKTYCWEITITNRIFHSVTIFTMTMQGGACERRRRRGAK